MTDIVMNIVGIRKILPNGQELLKGISLSFFQGAKIGVLGLNGAGKSTLMRIIAGQDKDYLGEVILGDGVRVGYLPQEPALDPTLDVRGNVELGMKGPKDLIARFDQVNERLGEPLSPEEMDKVLGEQARLQDAIDVAGAWDLESRLDLAMGALRCPPPDARVETLSGGEKRRVALTRLLLERPDILLLDEPTNHLDAESVAWLEGHLVDYPGTVLIVTHDRYFLDNVTKWVLELDRGRGIPWEGSYSTWLEQKQKRLQDEEKSSERLQKALAREFSYPCSSGDVMQLRGAFGWSWELDGVLRHTRRGREMGAWPT